YRFSISWPRTFPQGTGPPNTKGVDFYKRLTDELRANGIEPFATLYHWDLPQSLQDKYRGWQSKETAKAFADYAGYMAEQLGDRVKHFFTINEFRSFVEGGYQGSTCRSVGEKPCTSAGLRGCGCRTASSTRCATTAYWATDLRCRRSAPAAGRARRWALPKTCARWFQL